MNKSKINHVNLLANISKLPYRMNATLLSYGIMSNDIEAVQTSVNNYLSWKTSVEELGKGIDTLESQEIIEYDDPSSYLVSAIVFSNNKTFKEYLRSDPKIDDQILHNFMSWCDHDCVEKYKTLINHGNLKYTLKDNHKKSFWNNIIWNNPNSETLKKLEEDVGIGPAIVGDDVVKDITNNFYLSCDEKLSKLRNLDKLVKIDYKELDVDNLYRHLRFVDCCAPVMKFLLERGYNRFNELDEYSQTALFHLELERLSIKEEYASEIDEKIELLKKYGAVCPKNKYNHTPFNRYHHLYVKRLPYTEEHLIKESEIN
ncbi:hypothetical protein [Saudi moumouvirus]|nr:hypothetical protein [Saudi moumouvirus]